MNLQTIEASASPEVPMNENFETIDHASVYGKRQPVTTGLTWGYCGGRWGGFAVTEGTLTLTDNATNYIVVAIADGAITVSTSTTNWNDTATYARVYRVITSSGLVTTVDDFRAGPEGIHGGVGSSSSVGRHSIPINAGAMTPRASNGCAALATVEISAAQPNVVSLDFDSATQEYAHFVVFFPKSWDRGTVTFQPICGHASGGSTFEIAWSLAGVHVAHDGAMGVSFGTAQISQLSGGTENDVYIGPESPPITIAGSPASASVIPVFFEISRVTGHSSDDLDIDARLLGIIIHITTDAGTDA
jgi:hypothetical protein